MIATGEMRKSNTYQEISRTEFENKSWTTTSGLFRYVNCQRKKNGLLK